MARAKIELEFSRNFNKTRAMPSGVQETLDVLYEFQKKMIALQKHCLILLKTQVNLERLPRLFLSNLISCAKRTESSIEEYRTALINDVKEGNSQDLAQYKSDIEFTLRAAILIYTKRLIELSMLSSNEYLRTFMRDKNLQEIYTDLDGYLGSPQNPNFSQLRASPCYSKKETGGTYRIYSGRRIADVGQEVRKQMDMPKIPDIYESPTSIGVFYYKGIPYSANNRGLCVQSIAGVELPVTLILSTAEFRRYVNSRTQAIDVQRTTLKLFRSQTHLNTNQIILEDGKKSVVERPKRLMPMSELISRVMNPVAAANQLVAPPADSSSEVLPQHSPTGC